MYKATNAELNEGESYLYTINASDHGAPARIAKVRIRIDTFDPNNYAIEIDLDLNPQEYLDLEDEFLTKICEIFAEDYPNARCSSWQWTSRLIGGTTSTRRLLQT